VKHALVRTTMLWRQLYLISPLREKADDLFLALYLKMGAFLTTHFGETHRFNRESIKLKDETS